MNIKSVVGEYGVKNVRVFMPLSRLQFGGLIPGIAFRCSNDQKFDTECEIVEDRYKVGEGYKITLKAIDENFGREHFYQSDFNSICESNHLSFRVYVLTIDGYQRVWVK